MKGRAPIIVLAVIIGAVLIMVLTRKTITTTMERVVACSVNAVIPAVESALVETGFHVIESKTSRDKGAEGRLAAEDQAGSVMSLVLGELPQGEVHVQITVAGDSGDEAAMSLLRNRLDNALQQLHEAREPR